MLRTALILICFLFIHSESHSQWKWLNPKPSGFPGTKIIFTDNQNGLLFQSNGDLSTTADQGTHWTVKQNLAGASVMDLKDSTGVACGYSKIYVSSDNGNTWIQKTFPSAPQQPLTLVDIVSRDTFFVADENGKVYRSDDRGNTWKNFNCGVQISSIEFINSKVGYAGAKSTYILKTEDGGATWQQNVTVNFSPSNTTAIRFVDINTGFAFREHSTMLRTTDGGLNWTTSDIHDKLYSIYFLNKTTGFVAGEDGVAYRTDDGGVTWNWIGASGRIAYYALFSTYFLDSSIGFTVGLRGRILKTTDGGTTWNQYSPTYIDIANVNVPTRDTIYALDPVMLYKSIDKGESWQQTATIPIGTNNDQLLNSYFFSADTGFVTVGNNFARIYKTYDGGQNWKRINPTPSSYETITDIQFLDPNTGYLALNIFYGGTIVKTKDRGETWTEAWSSEFFGEIFHKIFFINEKTGYASRYNQLYKTNDSARTWSLVWEKETISKITFINPRTGFVAGDNAMLRMTNDSGSTWVDIKLADQFFDDIYNLKFFNDKVGYLDAEGGAIYKTLDGGVKWKRDLAVFPTIRPISFGPDSSVYIAGAFGAILKFDHVGEVNIDSFNVTRPGNCRTGFSTYIAATLTKVDSIWYQFGVNDYDTEVLATPVSIVDTAKKVTAFADNLPPSTIYKMRLKLLYRGEYHYQILNSFFTPSKPITPTITAAPGIEFCQGDSVYLSSSAVLANQWFLNGTIINGATWQNLTIGLPGKYQVVRTIDCYSSDTVSVIITMLPLPPTPVITITGQTLSSSASAGNQWYLNDQPIPGANGATFNPVVSGTYKVRLTSGNCKSAFSQPAPFIVTSLNSPDFVNQFIIGPNPAYNEIIIKYAGNSTKLHCVLTDINGRQVYQANFTGSLVIDMRKMVKGVYFIEIKKQGTNARMSKVMVKQ